MSPGLHHLGEDRSNEARDCLANSEPRSLRTFTPSQAILDRSSGVFHWTPEGRRLYDFSSGVLVANLGHNPTAWMKRFVDYMGWDNFDPAGPNAFFTATPMTAYNAATPVEIEAVRRLLNLLQNRPGGTRLEQVLWAASGSEAIQKALWAALARAPQRDIILATRHGFHGKKGLAGAVTGSEADHDRDARVRFISFPREECLDVADRGKPFKLGAYARELENLHRELGTRIGTLITEPYLGGGGSFHPPKEYLQFLQSFCRRHDIIFILDEVQSNFGRTGNLCAFETYGLEPDIVVLGKGLGNGVPVAAAVGRADLFGSLDYGEGSDTWSANPLCCAAVLATLDEFATHDWIEHCRRASAVLEEGLVRLKDFPFVAHVRGEIGGMVWGVEMCDHAGRSAADWANASVLACYRGEAGTGIHLLGPLAKKVLRIAPPLVITEEQAADAMGLFRRVLAALAKRTIG
ncbi:MAG TPA: aspartate aminotransferase family protein [Gemmataceae bacterium]|nr:aspartate aminotransferase family protein [Gemmataceae bacterium]